MNSIPFLRSGQADLPHPGLAGGFTSLKIDRSEPRRDGEGTTDSTQEVASWHLRKQVVNMLREQIVGDRTRHAGRVGSGVFSSQTLARGPLR